MICMTIIRTHGTLVHVAAPLNACPKLGAIANELHSTRLACAELGNTSCMIGDKNQGPADNQKLYKYDILSKQSAWAPQR